MDTFLSMEEAYKKHSKMIYYFLLSKTGSQDLAEELTQETFYQAIKSLHTFQNQSSVSTWLCGIANNVWRKYARKQQKEKWVSFEDNQKEEQKHHSDRQRNEHMEMQMEPSVETQVMHRIDRVHILKLLHGVKEPIREVMYLKLIGDLSFKEIGEIMEQTENWARVNYYRGKCMIAKEVEKNEK